MYGGKQSEDWSFDVIWEDLKTSQLLLCLKVVLCDGIWGRGEGAASSHCVGKFSIYWAKYVLSRNKLMVLGKSAAVPPPQVDVVLYTYAIMWHEDKAMEE